MESPSAQNFDQLLRRAAETYFEISERGEVPRIEDCCEGRADVEKELRALLVLESESHDAPQAGLPRNSTLPSLPPRYSIIRVAGRGAMGEVFLAHDNDLDRQVAVKVIHELKTSIAPTEERFRRESRILSALDHPNIVPVYDLGAHEGRIFMTMKWLPGGDLTEDAGHYPAKRIAEIGIAIGSALGAAHERGIVHRDVKPANIMFDGDKPVLVDFGLARSDHGVTQTKEGTVAGTLLYMSPEQLEGTSASLDGRSDIYSLGVSLYEAWCGEAPFEDDVPERLIARILYDQPKSLDLEDRERDLETIILKCLEKNRTRRYQSAREAVHDLERFLGNEAIDARRSGFFAHALVKLRRYRKTAMIIAGLFLMTTILAFVLWDQSRKVERQLAGDVLRVERSLEEGLVYQARSQIDALSAVHGDDDVVRELADRVAQTEAEERLFDRIQRNGVLMYEADLRRLMKQLEDLGPSSHRQRLHDALLASAHYMLSEQSLLEDRLDRIEARDGKTAFTQLLREADLGSSVSSQLEKIDFQKNEALLLAALIQNASARPLVASGELIRAVLADDPSYVRARLARAYFLYRSNQLETAFEVFNGLDREQVNDDVRLRDMAGIRIDQGRLEEAAKILDRVPEDGRGTGYFIQMANLAFHEENAGRCQAICEKILSVNPGHPRANLILARLAMNRDQDRLAEQHIAAIDRQLMPPSYRVHVTIEELSLELRKLTRPGTDAPIDPKDLLDRIEQTIAKAPSKKSEAELRRMSAFLSALRGDDIRAGKQLLAALELYPESLPIRADLIVFGSRTARKELPEELFTTIPSQAFLMDRADSFCDDFYRSWKNGDKSAPKRTLDLSLRHGAILAMYRKDLDRLETLCRRYDEVADDTAEKSRTLVQLLKGLEILRSQANESK